MRRNLSTSKFLTYIPSQKYVYSLKNLRHQHKDYEPSIDEATREKFWLNQSHSLSWFKPPAHILTLDRPTSGNQGLKGDKILTFVDGQINMCYNCVDRHLMPHSNTPAIIYAKSPTEYLSVNYSELHARVNHLAHQLQSVYGLKSGDLVMIYLPHIPEAIYSMLACARLGIVFNISPSTLDHKGLAMKIQHLNPKMVITSQDIRRKTNFLQNLNNAFAEASVSNVRALVLTTETSQKPSEEIKFKGPVDYFDPLAITTVKDVRCVPLSPAHSLSLNETSGTETNEGIPRAVLRDTAGLAVYLNWLMRNTFNFDPRNVFFCAPGFSWTYGQNYGLFGPLLLGGTTFIYDGEWTDPEIYWKLLSNYKVNGFLTFPRFIDPAKQADPEGKRLEAYDFSALKTFTLTGERCHVRSFNWLKTRMPDTVELIDSYMQQETGFPIFYSKGSSHYMGLGFDPILANREDKDLKTGTHMGQLLLTLPLPPGCVGNCHNKVFNQELAVENKGKYYRTGDSGFINEDKKVEVCREEDIVTVGDNEFSSTVIEEELSYHRFIKKICVVAGLKKKEEGLPETNVKKRMYVRGRGVVWHKEPIFETEKMPVAFVVLTNPNAISQNELQEELIHMLKNDLSPLLSFRKVVAVKDLPKNINGMVLKGLLNDMCLNKGYSVPKNIVNKECLKEIEEKLK